MGFEQNVAAVLLVDLSAHSFLQVRLFVAVGIFRGELYLLAHHEFALCHARISAAEEGAVFHRQAIERIGSLYVEHLRLIVVVKSLQREVVLCNLFQHVADAALCPGGGSHEHEANGD